MNVRPAIGWRIGRRGEMKLNHFICPNCGHDFYDDYEYATCDACQCFFYASQSQTCELANSISFQHRNNSTASP